jgi:hypothetical protein
MHTDIKVRGDVQRWYNPLKACVSVMRRGAANTLPAFTGSRLDSSAIWPLRRRSRYTSQPHRLCASLMALQSAYVPALSVSLAFQVSACFEHAQLLQQRWPPWSAKFWRA